VWLLSSCQELLSAGIEIDDVFLQAVEECEVPARVQGVLADMLVEKGQAVAAGANLALVDDAESSGARDARALELSIAERNADNDVKVRLAEKSLEVASADLHRAEVANAEKANSVPPSQIDLLRAKVAHAHLEIENARHEQAVEHIRCKLKENELRAAELTWNRHRITAPIAGIVVDVFARKGEWVERSQSVVRIIRIEQLFVEAFVDAMVLPGRLDELPAVLQINLPGEMETRFHGQIEFVSPELDPADGRVLIRVAVDNSHQRLKPGMKARLLLNAAETRDFRPSSHVSE
jgi:multidrug efflux pump subunit AcrA (membrane-fusion protein)